MSVRYAVAALLLVGALGACSDGGPDAADTPPSSSTPTAAPLATGKSDLAVPPGRHLSPVGFTPALELQVPGGWTSVHRGADAFDLGKPDPGRDAPLVAVVVLHPPQASAAAAIAAVQHAATGDVASVKGTLAGLPAQGLDLTGGHGQVVASADGGVALDAAPGQLLRVLAVDLDGEPLLVAVLVPDADHPDDALAAAQELVAGISPG